MLIYGWRLCAPKEADDVYRALLFVAALGELGLAAEVWIADRLVMPFPDGMPLETGAEVDFADVRRAFAARQNQDIRVVVFVSSLARLVDPSPPIGDIPLVGHFGGMFDAKDQQIIAVGRAHDLVLYYFGPDTEESDRRLPVPKRAGRLLEARELVLPALWMAATVPGIRARAERNPTVRNLLALARERVIDPRNPPPLEYADVNTLLPGAGYPGHPPIVLMEFLGPSRVLVFEPWCAAMGLTLIRQVPGSVAVLHGWTVDVDDGLLIRDHRGGLVLQVDSLPDESRTALIREGACVLLAGINLGIKSAVPQDRPHRAGFAATMGWLAGGLVAITTGQAASLGEFYPVTIRPEDFVS